MRFAAALLLAAAGCLFIPGRAAAIPADAPPTGMVCTPGAVAGTTHTFDLTAQTGYIDTPDGNSVFMWSYAEAGGHFQSPGPGAVRDPGADRGGQPDQQPARARLDRLPRPGRRGERSGGAAGLLTTEAAASGGTVQYSFVAGSPGTYLYESGTDIAKQLEMGPCTGR
jgi:hypothetical protein